MENHKGPVLVSGSRSIGNYDMFCKLIKQTGWEITEIMHGGAKGVDSLAARYCKENKIPEVVMKADWNNHGNAAGPLRNQQMVELIKEKGGRVFVLHDGESRGTKHCKEYAESKGLEVYYCVLKQKEVFTIQTLEELKDKIKDAKLVSADVTRKVIEQLIQQKKEYIQVAQDCKIMWEALETCDIGYNSAGDCEYYYSSALVKKAMNTSTAKFLEEKRAKS
jgi:hypothetical protein